MGKGIKFNGKKKTIGDIRNINEHDLYVASKQINEEMKRTKYDSASMATKTIQNLYIKVLKDEFNFTLEDIRKLLGYIDEISDDIIDGKITWSEIYNELENFGLDT